MPDVLELIVTLVFAFTLIIVPIIGVFKPKTVWWIYEGWQYKNVEPSSTKLAFIRISSIIICLFVLATLLRQRDTDIILGLAVLTAPLVVLFFLARWIISKFRRGKTDWEKPGKDNSFGFIQFFSSLPQGVQKRFLETLSKEDLHNFIQLMQMHQEHLNQQLQQQSRQRQQLNQQQKTILQQFQQQFQQQMQQMRPIQDQMMKQFNQWAANEGIKGVAPFDQTV